MAMQHGHATIDDPRSLIETPRSDVLAEVLRVVRISAGVYFHATFPGAWAVTVVDGGKIARHLALPSKTLMVYHLVECGRCSIDVAGESIELGERDVIVLPYGDEHVIRTSRAVAPVSAESVMRSAVLEHGIVRLHRSGAGALTGIICGFFHCEGGLFNPLVRGLPPFVHCAAGAGGGVLRPTAEMIIGEARDASAGSAAMLARLSEVLVLEALRCHAAAAKDAGGWMRALADPLVGSALALLHAEPARAWTVEELARAVGASRSSLAERFTAQLGASPIAYLTSWRLQVAADRLAHGRDTIASIAEAVGYGSEAAFCRAFKRGTGASPAAWRSHPE